MKSVPKAILVRYKDPGSYAALIRRQLRGELASKPSSCAILAPEFRVSEATLRRRLDEENTSYKITKEKLRRDLAIAYLSDNNRSVVTICSALGFSERTAFYRAFKRWTGSAPGVFRRRHTAR